MVLRELLGLFVDDAGYAAAILLWIGVVGLALPMISLPASLRPWLLGGGLIAILVDSARRRSGR